MASASAKRHPATTILNPTERDEPILWFLTNGF